MAPDPRVCLHLASTACAAIFLSSLPYRLWQLRRCRRRSNSGYLRSLKAVLGVLLSVILSLYWLAAFDLYIPYKIYYLISLFASAIAALGLSVLLLQEQGRYHKASDQAKLYLLCFAVFDVVYLAMPTKSERDLNTTQPVAVRCVGHSVLFLLESWTKHPTVGTASRSPEETHGVLSRAFFFWINPLLVRGYRNVLGDEDLTPPDRDMKPTLTRGKMLESWSQRAEPATKKTLPLALFRCLKRPFFAAILPRLFLIVFRYSQPTLIKESIRYVTIDSMVVDDGRGFWLIISAISIYLGLALSTATYQHRLNKLKLMTRSAIIGLIHEKIMRSPSISYDDGQATTLMSNDADSLDGIGEMIHETWGQIIEVTIGMILLAREVGWVWPLPLFLIYLCSHMSRFVAKHLQPRQKAWNVATQNRIAATSSMLSEMKGVKMLGLQSKLTHRIQELRESELWEASKLRWIIVYSNASANALGIFSPAITLVLFAIISGTRGRDLDTETAFTTVAILGMITHPANMVMTIVPRAISAFAGFERIQSFLLQPSLPAYRATLPPISSQGPSSSSKSNSKSRRTSASNTVTEISNLAIGRAPPVLENVNINLARGTFTIISGPTGSGKSTLLRAILGEMPPSRGTISLPTHRIAYCAQRPWLPSGTIREVIYGVKSMNDKFEDHNEAWYREVTEICCLTHDFDSLPDGDQTQVGSRGLNLSGGQRQRVALARALFARCDILLLDDIFSGLDGETENTIFDNLFGPTGLIWRLETTVVLVSNASQYFNSADHNVVLGDRGIAEQGSWADIKTKAASIAKFSTGKSTAENPVISANLAKLNAQVQAKEETEADLSRRTGDPALYSYYFRSARFINLFLLVATTASYAFFITIPQYWLELWTDSDGSSNWFYIAGYIFLSTMSWASTSTQMWAVVIRLAPQSGTWLHERLLHTVTGAPISYFSQTANGSILNRFSQDIQFIDKQLPGALQTVVVQIFKLLMQILLLCFAQKWLAMSLPACMVVLWVVQKIYLRTSRQLRFLELQFRAGIFSSFLDSIEGLETIRSFGWSAAFIRDNARSVDAAQRPEFLLLCLQRWLNIVLDLLAAAIATGVVAIAVALRGSVTGGQVGIALNIMLVANQTLLKLVESYTTLENSLGAIARLKMLETLTPVEGAKTSSSSFDPPDNWPTRGHIKVRDITAAYHSDNTVLRNVSLDINAGQKLVVCGRTGSGKSTFLSVLLRLLELRSGTIEIDGVDIKHVRLEVLRQRCFVVVSQDPLLLPNETLRFNLAPDDHDSSSSGSGSSGSSITDEAIIDALSKAGLWHHFSSSSLSPVHSLSPNPTHTHNSTPTETETPSANEPATNNNTNTNNAKLRNLHPILDRKIRHFQNMSVGQTQVFALCRGIIKARSLRHDPHLLPQHHQHPHQQQGVKVKPKPIILLDEITSSLDPSTELMIQRLIADEFTTHGHTVIIVTHRLSPGLGPGLGLGPGPGFGLGLGLGLMPGRDAVALMADGRLKELITDLGPDILKDLGKM